MKKVIRYRDLFPFNLTSYEGIFSYIYNKKAIIGDWFTKDFATKLDIEFVLSESGYKRFNYALTSLGSEDLKKVLSDSYSGIIDNKFGEKWNTIYNLLLNESKKYDPLSEFKVTTTETPNLTSSRDLTKNDTITDTTTENKDKDTTLSSTKNEKTGTNITTTNETTNDNEVYGYNSTASVPSDTSTSSLNQTMVGDKESNITEGTSSDTGSVTESNTTNYNRELDVTENETTKQTGTKETISEGNKSKSYQELISSEIKLRELNNLINIMFNDVNKLLFLEVY